MISIFLQSIQTAIRGRSINLHTFFVNGSNFSGEHTTQVFWWTFFKENWAMVLYHLISIFIDSRSLTKKLWSLSIAESGSFGFLIVEVTFYGLFINHIKFHGLSFKETSFFAMHLFDNGPPGIPVCGVVLVFVSPLMKAVSMDLLRWYTISRTFHQWSSFRLISNRFNWFPWIFSQSKRYTRKFNQ